MPAARRFALRAALLVLTALTFSACCCGNRSSSSTTGASSTFCRDYRRTFLASCESTCNAKAPGKSATCSKGCGDALPRDATYAARCRLDSV